MKRLIFTCVVFFACGTVFGNEPTLAEPQSVLATPPAAAAAPVAKAKPTAVVTTSGACRNGACRFPRRTHTHTVTEGYCTDGNCQQYRVRTEEDTVTRRRWVGGGTVVRKNTRTVQQPVR